MRRVNQFAGICLAGLSSACAVGPNFHAPAPPKTSGFLPGTLPEATSKAPSPEVQAQQYVQGLDIPGQWWTLFQSAELNALIDQGLKNSPTLQAANAALRQANETAAAERGSYYPSVSAGAGVTRQKVPGTAFGAPQSSSILYTLNNATANVSYTLDVFGGIRRQVESLDAQAEYEKFALEAAYLSLTANVVTAAITEA
jgi:outer membrane protein TolC